MTKVKFLLVIAIIVVVVNAYPLEEDSQSPSLKQDAKVAPLLVAESSLKKQDTKETQDETSDDSKQDSSESSDSTEQAYIEETYIEVLLPGVPQLNSTQLESILNNTADNTKGDDRLKRNSDNREDNSEDSSEQKSKLPTSSSTAPPALYQLRNLNSRPTRDLQKEGNISGKDKSLEEKSKLPSSSTPAHEPPSAQNPRYVRDTSDSSSSEESSEEKSKESSDSSTLPPTLYQLRNLNARPARDSKKSSSSSSEESSEEKEHSSSNQNSSEQKSKPSNSSLNSRPVREALENKDNSPSNKDLNANPQQSSSTAATPALYSAQNFYSRPGREAPGKDVAPVREESPNDSESASRNIKTPAAQSSQHVDTRNAREVGDSSEKNSSSDSTVGSVVYVTPRSKALSASANISEEASASGSPPAIAAERLKLTSVER